MTFKGAIDRWRLALWITLALLAPCITHAQVVVPSLTGHVTDKTGTLTHDQKSTLEQSLSAFEARKGTQLAILIIPSTLPEGIEQYALRVAEQWELGRKKVDDGVIVVVAKNDRTVRIEVGYGLEGALSDIVSKRIISEFVVPRFKQGDYFGGLQSGTDQMMKIVDGESLPALQNDQRYFDTSIRQFLPFLFILSLSIGGVLRHVLGKVSGAMVTGVIVSGLAWLVVGSLFLTVFTGIAAMLVTLVGSATVFHGLGGMSGSGRHGSGGGGFRGGGGGFGGGGASGRW